MLDFNKDNFAAEVLEAPGKIFVMFTGDGWAPCAAIKPFVAGCSEKYGDKLKFGTVNTGTNKRLAIGQRVMGIPTMVVYEKGEKVETLGKDDASEANIEAFIQRHI